MSVDGQGLSYSCIQCAKYSASQDDRATVGCFVDFQEISGPVSVKLKQYPEVLHLSSEDDAQSASL